MATQDMYRPPRRQPPQAPTGATITSGPGILERWRQRHAEQKRRVLARWLRRTAKRANDPDPIRRRREALLHYRAAAVRTELLELAAMLERAHEPDPACIVALHDLLANGCDSPLYNANIPICELHAAIHRVRSGLASQPHP